MKKQTWSEWSESIRKSLEKNLGPNVGLAHLEQVISRSSSDKLCAQCGSAGEVRQNSALIKSVKTYWLCQECHTHYQIKG